MKIAIVEDNDRLRMGLRKGLEALDLEVSFHCGSGEEALERMAAHEPQALLMDVSLAGQMNGVESMVAIRREWPRMPVVFYSIEDDDRYFDDFLKSGILSHFAFVRKSNYLLPEMIEPLLRDAVSGRSFIDPEIEDRFSDIRSRQQTPLDMLEPNERRVALMLADGMTNEQIAKQMGFKDKRTISRINGQIYAIWGLNESAADEKVARTRASIIIRENRFITWDEHGRPHEE